MRIYASLVGLLLALCAAGVPAAAEPYPVEDLPPALSSWVDWVLFEVPDHACPRVSGTATCTWPGELVLRIDGGGGRFSQRVTTDAADMVVFLPGDEAHWPQEVRLNGKAATVFELDARPAVVLPRGSWLIEGAMRWNELPEGIRIPAETGVVSLSIDGIETPFPRRDEDGLLWLQSAAGADQEGDRLDLEVYRMLSDGIPLTVTTRLTLRVSGKSREIDLGPALLAGTTIMSVDAGIPARVDKDGRLRLQVRAGTHEVTVVARTDGQLEKIASATRAPPWPEEEIWVWRADETLRQVALEGPPGVDPSRTAMPREWMGLPAFLVGPSDTLLLRTTRRGEPDPPPDQVSLSRELWMDLDGDGFTVRDSMSGTLNQTWRLDLEVDGALGHVQVDGVDQLITENPKTSKPGVELRNGALDMKAEWRIESGAASLPAVGWTKDVQDLGATLNLPPGWTLLTAKGVDEIPNTWWDEWDLFGFFFVLLVSMGIARLTRWFWGLVALVTLVLLHQEAELGVVVFISVSLLVFLGLIKVLPMGRLHMAARICWWVTVLLLVLALIPFSVQHIRTGLYPQIDESGGYNDFDMVPNLVLAAPMVGTAKEIAPETIVDEEQDQGLEEIMAGEKLEGANAPAPEMQMKRKVDLPQQQQIQTDGRDATIADVLSSVSSANRYESISGKVGPKKGQWRKAAQQDPKAVVQTGPGVPTWNWKSWSLGWSGPVDKDHTVRLYTIGPKTNMLLSFLRVLLLVLLGAVMIREAVRAIRAKRGQPEPPRDKGASDAQTGAKAAAAVAVLVSLLAPATAKAEEACVPDRATLDQLRERLTPEAPCEPDCVSISLLSIAIDDGTISLTAEVHAAAPSSWKVPGPAGNWVPARVMVDKRPTTAMALLDDGFIHVRLDRGTHVVEAIGQPPPNDAVTLELGQQPHRAEANAPGWSVDGLREDGRAETSVQLSRIRTADSPDAAAGFDESSYPPWLEITRTLDLGIPWLVHTTVRRVSPAGSPVMARIPLLEGESVTESALQVENGEVVLSMGRDDTEVAWSSTLTERDALVLEAPVGKPWTEVWVLGCSPVWRCGHEGLPPIRHKNGDRLEPTFRPWPGERLTVTAQRPRGVEGQSITIDSAKLTVSPGIRLQKALLELFVRSSQGGVQTITLPEGAEIQELTVDGAKRPVRQEGRVVEITLQPGSQSINLSWQQPGGITAKTVVPKVDLGGPAANVRTVVDLPSDRWLLMTSGPKWGPAILFWGYVAAILLGGLILGSLKLSPLKRWQWMLLALGLTQVPAPVALVIVGWFFVLAWRRRKPPAHFFWHNTLQIGIGLWTLAALICLFAAVYFGLAVQPDMQVAGSSSSNTHLVWYVDRVAGGMSTPTVYSLPLLVWKIAMLVWSLWLAWSLVRWSRWGWKAFSAEVLWRSFPRRTVPPRPLPPQQPDPPPPEG